MTSTILHRARATALAGVVAVAVTLVAGVASASAYTPTTAYKPGPGACLLGYVWREAVPNDYVCVTPATRSQTAYDNSQKDRRLQRIGARFYDCVQGYVFREAVPLDFVCVTPATRSQAAYDNSQAIARRDSLNIWTTVYGVSTGPGETCSGDTCTITEPSGYQALSIHADHVNVGSVTVALRRIGTNALRRVWRVDATTAGYTPGGRLDLNTGVIDCVPKKPDSYFTIRDPSSGRWSARHYVATQCGVL